VTLVGDTAKSAKLAKIHVSKNLGPGSMRMQIFSLTSGTERGEYILPPANATRRKMSDDVFGL
jgi:hypothetical protein